VLTGAKRRKKMDVLFLKKRKSRIEERTTAKRTLTERRRRE
jgi:hypothetical protein